MSRSLLAKSPKLLHLQSTLISQTHLNSVISGLAEVIFTVAQRTLVKYRLQFVLGELSESKHVNHTV